MTGVQTCALPILDGKPVQLWVLDSIQHSKLVCPVDEVVAMLFRLDSCMDFIINGFSLECIIFFNNKIIHYVNYRTGMQCKIICYKANPMKGFPACKLDER